MADLNCAACEEIREEVPELIVNGFSNTMCTSLKNDTGLKSSSGHNDCTDLDKLNDCLVGNMETEIDRYDVCDWKDFTKNLINNLWTTLKAMICAICGLWTNVHNLWSYARSFTLKKNGNKIYLEASDGIHGQVTDDDTKYDLSISGHTVTLTGSDGTTDSVTVPDNNTTYDLSISGHTVKLTGSDGSQDSVTVPDNNTTYDLSISGHTVKLTGSDGSTDSVTVPDNNTTYGISRSGHTVTLVPGGTNMSVTIPDDDHTRIGVTLINVKMKNSLAGNSATGEKTITSSTTRNSISGFEIWNENGGDILRPPSDISSYRMFGLVGYSSDHWQIMSAGSFVEINNQTLTFQFVNMSPNTVSDDVVIQFHLAWYRPDNNN